VWECSDWLFLSTVGVYMVWGRTRCCMIIEVFEVVERSVVVTGELVS